MTDNYNDNQNNFTPNSSADANTNAGANEQTNGFSQNAASWRIDPDSYSNTGYHSTYTAPNPPQNPIPPKKTKKKSSGSFRFAAITIALCMILSAGCGFGGALTANLLMKTDSAQNEQNFDSKNGSLFEDAPSEPESDNSNQADASHAAVSGKTLSTEDVVKKCADSVVEIVTESVSRDSMFGQYVTSGAGSGVILTEDGYIVTNHHVIDGATNIKVRLRNGTDYTASLVATDPQSDLAVLKIEGKNLTKAVFANSDTLQVGQTAIAIGNPLGSLGGSVSEGILSALDREITIEDNVMTLLQTDAAINPGNSGGGLFNDRGELIGIVNAKSSGANIDGLGFAIPANLVKTNAEQLIRQGYVSGRVFTGMSVIEINDLYTAFYYGVSRTGVYVQNVTGSNAADAGFKSGDCIVSVGDTAVATVSDFNAAIKQYAIGDTVKLGVIRGNKQAALTLTLAEFTGEAGA